MPHIKFIFTVNILEEEMKETDKLFFKIPMSDIIDKRRFIFVTELTYVPPIGMEMLNITHPVKDHTVVFENVSGDKNTMTVNMRGCQGTLDALFDVINNLHTYGWKEIEDNE